MIYDDDKVKEILQKIPSECPYIDYKEIPYKANKKHDFIKDVIAMLNSEGAIGHDKFIIFGVKDSTKELIGIEPEKMEDDNEWQNLVKKISPRPDVRTGCVLFQEKHFGFICIPASNMEWVYEVAETCISSKDDQVKQANIAAKGQAFTRFGSTNDILMSDGRKRLLEKRTQRLHLYAPIVPNDSNAKIAFLTLTLLGGWSEKYTGDIEVVEKISGMRIETVKGILRNEHESYPDRVKFFDGCWNVSDHLSSLLDEATHIFDDHIDSFFEIAFSCLTEVDPKYELPSNQRSFSSLYNRDTKKKYSDTLIHGLAETLAIFGNHDKSFSKCSRNKVLASIYKLEREFFKTVNWKVYATVSKEIPLLGEARPDVFMEEINRLLRSDDVAFLQYLTEKEDSITAIQYGYEIGHVLSIIAKKDEYFSKAMDTLLLLSKVRPQFIDTMVSIVLPWYPQTHASAAVRVGVFKGLAQEDENLTWDILMKLMPRAVTTSSPIQNALYMDIDDLPEQVDPNEYNKTSIEYIRLAKELMGSDANRICSMLSVIDVVDMSLQTEIIDSIKEVSVTLDEPSKAKVWNGIKDFVHKHRKFSDATWALGEDRLLSVEKLATLIVPDAKALSTIRLFRNDQYSLLMDRDNYSEEENHLKEEQTKALEGIYKENGVSKLRDFLAEIENPKIAGARASSFLSDDDIRFFIRKSENLESDAFLEGVITSYSFERVESIIKEFPDEKKAGLIDKLPITDKLVLYVKTLDKKVQIDFWKNTYVWGFMSDDFSLLEDTVTSLNRVHRTEKSISLLYFFIVHSRSNPGVNPELVIETLNLNVENQAENTQDEYHIQQLIKWLQERNIEKKCMLETEWKYLAFLKDSEGYPPINLWRELSDNPEFFIWVAKIVCGKESDPSWNEEDKQKIVSHCFGLLHSWKRVPGLDENGRINKEVLDNWISVVKEKSSEFGIEGLTMSYFGKVAFHSPADEDGFFIDREVAKYLQADVSGSVLSGYHSEAINSRGIHVVDYTGETEFKIEESYIIKARMADENGFFRLAETLRDIAASYHEEGIRNKELRIEEEI